VKSTLVKYLGIYIDPVLSFKAHIAAVVRKCSCIVGILKQFHGCLNMPVRQLIYFGLIHSLLNFGSIIGGQTYDVHMDDLLKIQKRVIRVICGVPYRAHTSSMFMENGIWPLTKLISSNSCNCVHRNVNGRILSSTIIFRNSQFHDHDTRQESHLHMFNNNTTNYGSSSILHASKSLSNACRSSKKK
jgi:hypothetical protein